MPFPAASSLLMEGGFALDLVQARVLHNSQIMWLPEHLFQDSHLVTLYSLKVTFVPRPPLGNPRHRPHGLEPAVANNVLLEKYL